MEKDIDFLRLLLERDYNKIESSYSSFEITTLLNYCKYKGFINNLNYQESESLSLKFLDITITVKGIKHLQSTLKRGTVDEKEQ